MNGDEIRAEIKIDEVHKTDETRLFDWGVCIYLPEKDQSRTMNILSEYEATEIVRRINQPDVLKFVEEMIDEKDEWLDNGCWNKEPKWELNTLTELKNRIESKTRA